MGLLSCFGASPYNVEPQISQSHPVSDTDALREAAEVAKKKVAEKENVALRARIAELETKFSGSGQQADTNGLNQDLELFQQELEVARAATESAKQEAREAQKNLSLLQSKVELLEQENERLQEECDSLKEDQGNRAAGFPDVRNLELKARKQQATMDEMQAQLTMLLEVHGLDMLLPVHSSNGASIGDVNSSGGGVSDAAAPSNDPQTLIKRLQQLMQGYTAREQSLTTSIQDLEKRVEVLQLEKASIQSAHDVAFDEGQAAREEVSRLEVEVQELKAQLAARDESQVAGAEAEKHLAAARTSLAQTMSIASHLEEQLQNLAQENARLTEELQAGRSQSKAGSQADGVVQVGVKLPQHQEDVSNASMGGKAIAGNAASDNAPATLQDQLSAALLGKAAAEAEVQTLHQELQSQVDAAEGTAQQVGMLLVEIQTLKARCGELEHRLRTKDEMMGVLEEELSKVTELDLDSVVSAAVQGSRHPKALAALRGAPEPEAMMI